MTKPKLRAVKDDEKAPKKKVHKKIADALDGSALDVLLSMRQALAIQLDEGKIASNSIASTYKELRELDKQIRALTLEELEDEAQLSGQDVDNTFDASAI